MIDRLTRDHTEVFSLSNKFPLLDAALCQQAIFLVSRSLFARASELATSQTAAVRRMPELAEDEPSASTAKRHKTNRRRGACQGAVPQDVQRDQPEHSVPLGNKARHEQHCAAGRLCCHPQTQLSEHIPASDRRLLCLSAVTIRNMVHEWLDAEELDARPRLGSDSFCTACA